MYSQPMIALFQFRSSGFPKVTLGFIVRVDSANTQAELFAFGAECIFYGIYLISVWVCMSVLLTFAGGITVRRWPFFLVALLLFALSTFDVALGLRHLLDAFVYYHGPGGATAELLDISHWVSVMKVAAFLAQTCVADGMLVYRSYVIYARNWKIAAGLSVLWSVGVASSIYSVVMQATLHQSSTLSAGRFTRLALANASVTLVLNIVATSLIVYRIWSFDRFNKDKNEGDLRSDSTLRRAMRIIIESGAVYTVSVIVLFISNLAKSNSLYLISDCIMQIIGIVFNLIIIRVEQGSAKDTAYGGSKDLVSLQFQQRSALGETTHVGDLEEGKQDILESK